MIRNKFSKIALLCALSPSIAWASQVTPYGVTLVQADLVNETLNPSKKVCIIGTGYDLNHPDLISTANVTGEVSNTLTSAIDLGQWSSDIYGQGTSDAGIIAALDNTIGVKGINGSGNINLHIVKVVHKANWWSYINTGMAAAVQSCQAAGSDIINMGLSTTAYSAEEEQALQAAFDSGILLIGAAGNRGNSTYYYPASYDSVVSVGAVDIQSQAWAYTQRNDQIELVAPGVEINSTMPGDVYSRVDGTGPASSYVAGVAALVWEQFPDCNNQQIRDALVNSALDLGDQDFDTVYGNGLLQAKSAVDYLTSNSCNPNAGGDTPVVEGVELTEDNSRIVELANGDIMVVWTEQVDGEIHVSRQLFDANNQPIDSKTLLDILPADYSIFDVLIGEQEQFTIVMTQSTAEGDITHSQLFDSHGAMITNQVLADSGPINVSNQTNAQELMDIAKGDGWAVEPYGIDYSADNLIAQWPRGLDLKISNDGVEHKAYSYKVNYINTLIYQGGGSKESVLPTSLTCDSLYHALAVDSNNNPHIVANCGYSDVAGEEKQKSYYAYRDALGWHATLTPRLDGGSNFTLAIDSQGTPHVSYFVGQGTSYYAYFDGTNWQKAIISPTAYYPTLALNNNDEAIVIYYSFSPYILRAAVPVIASPTYTYMDSIDLPIEGSAPSAAYDAQGRLHISSANSARSKIQHSVFDGTTWTSEDVADAKYSSYSSIAIDNNGNPLIAYQKEVFYPQQKHHTYLADKRSGNWQDTLVAGLGSVNRMSLQLDATGEPVVGMYGYPLVVEATYGAWTQVSWTTLANEFWNSLGYLNTISEGYAQYSSSLAIARVSNQPAAPKVEQGSYVIATGASDKDYFLRFDSTGQYLTRAPSFYDSSSNTQPAVKSDINTGSSGVTMGDFDNDGLTDYITAGYQTGTGDVIIEFHRKVSQSLNVFDSIVNTPTQIIDRLELTSVYTTGDLASADFNQDGNLDFVRNKASSTDMYIYLGNGDGTFQTAYPVTGGSMPHYGLDTGDVNNDGHADFVASGGFDTSAVDVYQGDGTGNFVVHKMQLAQNDQGYSTAAGITLSDFDSDGTMDIVLTNYSGNLSNSNGLAFYKGLGNGQFALNPVYSAPEMGNSIISATAFRNIDNAYFNQDSIMDVIVSDSQKKTIRVYLGVGDGTFVQKDQHFATHPMLNGGCSGTLCLLDPALTEMYDHLNLYRSDAPKGIATPVYTQLSPPVSQ